MGPGLIGDNPSNITTLLLVCLGMSIVPLAAVWMKMPIAPRWRVPGAISNSPGDEKKGGIGSTSGKQFFFEAARLVVNEPALSLLMLATALGVGVYDSWIGILPQLLTANSTHHGKNWTMKDDWGPNDDNGVHVLRNSNATAPWSPQLAGLCGMAHTFSCIAGMWTIGPTADRFFRRRLKTLLVLLFAIAAILFGFVVSLFENQYLPWTPIPHTVPTVFAAVILVGFFRSGTSAW